MKHVLYWCTIGGTSVSSPLIASVFALAGGADKVEYPAKTLYENEAKSPGVLHDVTTGSNGECTKPFTETGLSGCTSMEESKSCASKAICLAGAGYDGPTGVGTPDGITAFKPVTTTPISLHKPPTERPSRVDSSLPESCGPFDGSGIRWHTERMRVMETCGLLLSRA